MKQTVSGESQDRDSPLKSSMRIVILKALNPRAAIYNTSYTFLKSNTNSMQR